ncbi:MAG: DNA polymerase III subunit delta' [Candidatus Omnitrophica bacterium]|nr:DNA polymerase III subunit delta' [Candidatus Omnitrophota bacterium]
MSFKDIRGHDRLIAILKKYMQSQRIPSAFLFLGPEGIGKGLVARALAGALNCTEETSRPCGRCPSCLKIERNQHPDFFILGASDDKNNGDTPAIKIEQIRQLQNRISLKAYEAKFKAVIIENAHNLTAESSNALLKVLEEPPPDTVFMIISSKPALLFKTIISRCQILRFSALPPAELEIILKKDYGLNTQEAHFLAFFCEGRLGSALKHRDDGLFRQKNTIIDSFRSGDKPLPDYLEDKDTIRLSFSLLAGWLRDLYLLKSGAAGNQGLINLDQKERLSEAIRRYRFSDLDEALRQVSNSSLYLEQNVNSKLLLSCLRGFIRG